jgi:site-specific DNA-methyltransferase (adenine-specific)
MRLNYIDNGDCLEGFKLLPDKSVDLIVTDPPYGTTACKWDKVVPFEKLWAEYERVLKPGAACVIFGSEPFSTRLRQSNLSNFKYDWVWEKEQGANFMNVKFQPYKVHELISVFYADKEHYNPQMTSGKPYKSGKGTSGDITGNVVKVQTTNQGTRYPRSILRFNTDKAKGSLHPTQKPLALIEYLVRTYSNPGDLVLDTFMGSGTTAVACIKTGRNFIGFELDEGYHESAQLRIEEAYIEQLKELGV